MARNGHIIELYENENQVISAAIDRIVVELLNKRTDEAKSQSILMTGCSPLAGTTSTCIGLGIAMATAQRKTLLIDCDVRKTLKYKKLNENTNLGLANYLLQDIKEGENYNVLQAEDIIYQTNIENLSYIPCGKYTENSTRILCSKRMTQLIEDVKEQYEYIIFDFPSLTVAPDAQILFREVDGIVLLAASGETTKGQIKNAKLKIKPFMEKYYGMIVNKLEMGMYKGYVKNYDYYFINKKGEQNLNGSQAPKKYKKNLNKLGE